MRDNVRKVLPGPYHWSRLWGRQRYALVALSIIGITLTALWLQARPQAFLICDMNCGETVLSVRAANQFASYGVQYGLLENLGDQGNPQIYTHSVNIGTLTFVALEALGVHSFSVKELLPLAAFGLGLFYVYLTVRLFTSSGLAAITTLLVFATAYWGLGAFAFNALRAWHMFAFFAVIYHVTKLNCSDDKPHRWRHLVGLQLAAIVAFGCGYDFWLPCGGVAVALVLFNGTASQWRKLITRLGWIVIAFALPFVLRQFQVIYALGLGYWLQDFIFSVAIKIPDASRIIHIPSIPEIDAFYRAHHVLRPPAFPTNSIRQILYTSVHMIEAVTLPRWGIVSILTLTAMLGYATLIRLHILPLRLSAPPKVAAALTDLILPASIGIAAGIAVFAPFSLHVYLKHEFPLVAFPILLAKGLAIFWLASLATSYGIRASGVISAVAIMVYVADALMVHVNNTNNGLYANFEWRRFVQTHPGAHFILSTYGMPNAADPMLGLDRVDVTYYDPADAFETGHTINHHMPPATVRHPTYWIYQPADHVVDFDAPEPSCRWHDWILGAAESMVHNGIEKPRLAGPWITPTHAGVGTTLTFGAGLKGFDHRRETIEIQTTAFVPRPPVYNCIYHRLIGWATVKHASSEPLTINVLSVDQHAKPRLLYRFIVPVTDTPEHTAAIGVPAKSDPSISAVVSAFPNYRVVDRDSHGIGYVIFEISK